MKKILAVLIGLMMVFGVASMSSAAIWTGTYNPSPNIYIGGGSWINEYNVSLVGFNPLTDTVTSAYAVVYVYDDSDSSYEYARVNFTTSNVDQYSWEVDGTSGSPTSVTIQLLNGYAGFNNDGATPFSLWATSGDFYFDRIVYTAEGTSVPEPTSMLLIGLGLVGFAAVRRRK